MRKIFRKILNRVIVCAAPLAVLLVFFSVLEMTLQITNFTGARQAKQEVKSGRDFGLKTLGTYVKYPNMNRKNELLFLMGRPLAPVNPTVFGPYDKDSLLFWKLRPDPTNNVNERRFRGKLVSYPKPQDTFRILVIGDSCAYGMWVGSRDTYAHILEVKLNAQGSKRFEVINAGVPGYSSLQGLRYLKTELLKYQPDCIIAGFGFNDLCEAIGKKDKDIPISLFSACLITIDNGLANLRSYRFMKQLAFAIRYRCLKFFNRSKVSVPQHKYPKLEEIRDVDTLIIAQSATLFGSLRRVPPQDFYDSITEIIKLTRAHHSQLFLLTLPSISGCFGYGPMLRLIAKKYDVSLVDLIEEFRNRNANSHDFFADDNHYSPKGHRLIADVLFERLLEFNGTSH